MAITAEALIKKTNETLGGNVCLYDAYGNPISLLGLATPDTLSSGNSSTSLLAANGTFTGAWVSTLGYAQISLMVFADVVSAANGLQFQFSADGATIDYVSKWTYDASHVSLGIAHAQTVPARGAFVRIVYTNGPTPQTAFRLSTILKTKPTSGAIMDVDNIVLDHHQALLTKALIVGKSTAGGGAYVDVKVNPSGTLLVGGSHAPADSEANPTANVPVSSYLIGYNNTTGLWSRLRISNTSTVTALPVHALEVNSFSFGYNAAGGAAALMALRSNASDTLNDTQDNHIQTKSHLLLFNGASYDRARSVNTGQLVVTLKDSSGDEPNVEARTQTPTGNALNVQIGPGDVLNTTPVVIDWEHHQVHEGETHKVFDIQASLGATTYKYSLVVGALTATTRTPHLRISVFVYNGAVQIDLYEGATHTGGAAKTAYNRNRNSAITPNMTVTAGVTSTNGTQIDSLYAGAGLRGGGEARSEVEWDLKASTEYRVDLIGLVANTQAIIHFDWYEDLGV